MAPNEEQGPGADPSPAGEGGSREARDGWGPRRREVPLSVARRLRKTLTPQETKLWVRLRDMKEQGLHFRKQVPIESFVVDFACLRLKLVVEIDGEQHGFETRRSKDERRDAQLAALGYRVLRFWNHEVDHEMRVVLDTVFAACAERDPYPSSASPPPPSPAGEGSPTIGRRATDLDRSPDEKPSRGADPSPAGEGGSREAREGWGPRIRSRQE
jgi:very-short-patch-repair endonuclease